MKPGWVAVVGLAAACAHAKPAARRPSGCRFSVVGEISLRACGGPVDVVALRRYADHTVGGSARLFGVTLEGAAASSFTRVAAARAWLALATLSQDEPVALGEICERGIDELGTDYMFVGARRSLDDTGNLIHWADELKKRGNQREAAETLCHVLGARVDLTLRAYRGAVE